MARAKAVVLEAHEPAQLGPAAPAALTAVFNGQLLAPKNDCQSARKDDGLIDGLARRGIVYVPFFPLGGFTPLQSSALDRAAAAVGATPIQLALAWLLQRSPNILLIPGTSSVKHLRENLEAATLRDRKST